MQFSFVLVAHRRQRSGRSGARAFPVLCRSRPEECLGLQTDRNRPTLPAADFCGFITAPHGAVSTKANPQISPGNAHPPSRLYPPHLRPHLPCKFWALKSYAFSPDATASYAVSVRWASALPYRLPSDPASRQAPLPSANGSPCRARKGLTPSSGCALPGAQKKAAETAA